MKYAVYNVFSNVFVLFYVQITKENIFKVFIYRHDNYFIFTENIDIFKFFTLIYT